MKQQRMNSTFKVVEEKSTVWASYGTYPNLEFRQKIGTRCTYYYRGFTFFLNLHRGKGNLYQITEQITGTSVMDIPTVSSPYDAGTLLKRKLDTHWDSYMNCYTKVALTSIPGAAVDLNLITLLFNQH